MQLVPLDAIAAARTGRAESRAACGQPTATMAVPTSRCWFVEVERKRDLLPAVMAEQITGELSGCRRTVDPARERQRHLRFGMRRGCTKAHPADE